MNNSPRPSEFDTFDPLLTSSDGGLLRMLWRRKFLIVLGAALGLTWGFINYRQKPSVYKSTAQVLMVKKRTNVASAGMSGVDDYVAAQARIIRSPLIVKRAIDEGKLPPQNRIGQRHSLNSIVRALSGNVNGNILTVSFHGPDPVMCRQVLEAVILSYEEFLRDTLNKTNEDTLQHITDKAEELHNKLQSDEIRYQQLGEQMPLFRQSRQGNTIHHDRLATLESKAYALKVRRTELELRLRAIEQGNFSVPSDGVLPEASEHSKRKLIAAAALEKELLPLRLKVRMLLEDFGEDYPEVQAARREIQLRRELSAHNHSAPEYESSHAEAYIASLHEDLKAIQLSETVLTELFAKEHAEARQLKDAQNESKRLNQEIERTQRFHDTLMKQLQQVNFGKELGGYITSIISPATLGVKVAPSHRKILAVAAMWGILGAFGLAYVIDISDKRFHTPDEIRQRLHLPVVGQVPLLKHSRKTSLGTSPDGEALDPTLQDYHISKSSHAEAFRSVRRTLLFGTHAEQHKIVQITSPNVGDGKTTIAANLAVSIAQAGKSMLLIDADLRTPRIHKMFGLSSQAGLATVLAGESELQDVIRESGVPGLMVLPCGPVPSNPAELLTSSRLRELIEEVRSKYEHVIVDTSSLLDVSDPCVVTHSAEGVLLVIRTNRGSRFDAEKAIETMGPLAAKLIGVVVNNKDGHWRPSPPHLLIPNNSSIGNRHEFRALELGRYEKILAESPASFGFGEPQAANGHSKSTALPPAPPQDFVKLEASIEQLTSELRQLIAGAEPKNLGTKDIHLNQGPPAE